MAAKVRGPKHFFQVIYNTPYLRSSSIKGRLPSKVIFRHRLSFVKVVLRQRSFFVKGLLLSKVVFHQRSFFLIFSPQCGIAQLDPYIVHFIFRDSPYVVHFKFRDSHYIVHFKCRDCPYVVHFKCRDCPYV